MTDPFKLDGELGCITWITHVGAGRSFNAPRSPKVGYTSALVSVAVISDVSCS
jgi:hypothetical protein